MAPRRRRRARPDQGDEALDPQPQAWRGGHGGLNRTPPDVDTHFLPEAATLTVNRWILTELARTERDVTEAIENQRFNEAAGSLYRFVWNQVCDWYLELLKPVFGGTDETAKAEAQACVAYVLEQTYKLLHPFMPYMTEELWAHTAGEGA